MDFTKKSSGWDLSFRYNTDVLQGNWYEDRMAFQRGSHPEVNASTNRQAFQPHDGGKGELLFNKEKRMTGVLKNDGIKPQSLVHHHGKAYVDGLAITSYDQDFARSGVSQPRCWDKWNTEWRPQKSDFPLQGMPTSTGALERLKVRIKKEEELEKRSDYSTTQRLSFTAPDTMSFTGKRFATPRVWSTHLHPHVQNNNLTLRGHANAVKVERYNLADASGGGLPDVTS